jgi:hypothetical protein
VSLRHVVVITLGTVGAYAVSSGNLLAFGLVLVVAALSGYFSKDLGL